MAPANQRLRDFSEFSEHQFTTSRGGTHEDFCRTSADSDSGRSELGYKVTRTPATAAGRYIVTEVGKRGAAMAC